MARGIGQWLQRLTNRLGFDVIRYPSSRLRSGHMMRLVRELSIDTVLDVGANIGQYGDFLRSIGYRGRIVSFEPLSDAHAALTARAAKDSDWRVVRAALGTSDGEATMNVSRASVMTSLRTPTDAGAASVGADLDTVRHETVPVRRLDGIFDEHVEPEASVFLKLAVQGWDLEVLKGAAGCLPRVLAVQDIVSVHPLYDGMPDWLESLTYLRGLGFEPTGFFPVLHYGDLQVSEFDAILVRPY